VEIEYLAREDPQATTRKKAMGQDIPRGEAE
jgi:hypothetical protein